MKPELGFKVEVAVEQAEEREWGMEKALGVRKRKAQRHESIRYFSTE